MSLKTLRNAPPHGHPCHPRRPFFSGSTNSIPFLQPLTYTTLRVVSHWLALTAAVSATSSSRLQYLALKEREYERQNLTGIPSTMYSSLVNLNSTQMRTLPLALSFNLEAMSVKCLELSLAGVLFMHSQFQVTSYTVSSLIGEEASVELVSMLGKT